MHIPLYSSSKQKENKPAAAAAAAKAAVEAEAVAAAAEAAAVSAAAEVATGTVGWITATTQGLLYCVQHGPLPAVAAAAAAAAVGAAAMISEHPVLCYLTIICNTSIIALRLNLSATCRASLLFS